MLDLSLPMPPFTVARLKLLTLDSQKFSKQLNTTSIVYGNKLDETSSYLTMLFIQTNPNCLTNSR